ncbi:MAG: hypothetical protein ACI9CD_001205 [Candidatus Deianiraeaceae bacterium]
MIILTAKINTVNSITFSEEKIVLIISIYYLMINDK